MATAPAETSVRKVVCPHDCPDTCVMTVRVEGGRAVEIGGDKDHRFTQGFLCAKVNRYLERVYSPARLLHPLRRVGKKGEGRFTRISWDEALDEIAVRLRSVIAEHGPQAILPYSYAGNMGLLSYGSLDRRFFQKLGASLLARTICASAGAAGYKVTVGKSLGFDPEAVVHSRFIVAWGANIVSSNVHLWPFVEEARRRGAVLVTVDPYRSRTAEHADRHLALYPGTDAALALGVLHVIFRDGMQDQDYLDRYTVGGPELRERAKEWTPARTAATTGLPEADIEWFARTYAMTRPSAIRVNYGLNRHAGGGTAVRTIACLPAVTGAWRDVGGGVLLSCSGTFPVRTDALERPDLTPAGTRTLNMSQLGRILTDPTLDPPVKALFVYNSNPGAVAPEQEKVACRPAARGPVHRRPRALPHRHRRLRRRRPARDHDPRALRHPQGLRPSLREPEPARDRAARGVQAEHRGLPPARRPHGARRPVPLRERRGAGSTGLRLESSPSRGRDLRTSRE